MIALTTTGQAGPAAADHRLHTDTVTVPGSLSAIGSYTAENGSLQLMRAFMFAIAALVIGTVWTIQRSCDIAVLKALGATTRYLLRDALGQAVVIIALGSLGTALSIRRITSVDPLTALGSAR